MTLTPDQVIVPRDTATVAQLTREMDQWWSTRSFAEKFAAMDWVTDCATPSTEDVSGPVAAARREVARLRLQQACPNPAAHVEVRGPGSPGWLRSGDVL